MRKMNFNHDKTARPYKYHGKQMHHTSTSNKQYAIKAGAIVAITVAMAAVAKTSVTLASSLLETKEK